MFSERLREGENARVPTLQWTNHESVERRTVPRMPMRQCCLVRVSREVVGGSVWICVVSRRGKVEEGVLSYTGPVIAL